MECHRTTCPHYNKGELNNCVQYSDHTIDLCKEYMNPEHSLDKIVGLLQQLTAEVHQLNENLNSVHQSPELDKLRESERTKVKQMSLNHATMVANNE